MSAHQYVVGLAFNALGEKVVLMQKTHPEWQAGKLNGIGGKVEEGETPLAAMQREFQEEAGVCLTAWSHFATLQDKQAEILLYRCFDDEALTARSLTEEPVVILPVENRRIREDGIADLPRLVGLALDRTPSPVITLGTSYPCP